MTAVVRLSLMTAGEDWPTDPYAAGDGASSSRKKGATRRTKRKAPAHARNAVITARFGASISEG